MKLVLALNAGSSSLKASVLDAQDRLLSALAERLGTEASGLHMNFKDEAVDIRIDQANMTHDDALQKIVQALEERSLLQSIVAVGHRVVHGGTLFTDSTFIDDTALKRIEEVSPLAPLHNPYNLSGIRLIREILPNIPNVAVFDTSFHSTIPTHAYTYPLPPEYRDKQMRKFGFHGTSVKYVSQKTQSLLETVKPNRKAPFHLIVCHIGSGASVTAVSGLQSRDTSMGFTPLAGLMMGTRCGDVDPSLVGFACHSLNKSVDDVLTDFNKQSGLKGMVPGEDYDMRALLKRQGTNEKAALAVKMFVYRLGMHIASAMIALDGPLDALVFTAGIGEHSAEIRRRTIQQLAPVLPTAKLDEARNKKDGEGTKGVISVDGTWPLILDIPTDEEAMIVMECLRILANSGST